MDSIAKYFVLGVPVAAIDYDGVVRRVIHAAVQNEPLTVAPTPVHGITEAFLKPDYQARMREIDLVVPDGQPVRWALSILYGVKLADRVYGPELMLRICQAAADCSLPVYLYGSQPWVVSLLSERLINRFPKLIVAGAEAGLYEQLTEAQNAAMISRIRSSGARIVFVGLGCPRQEVWLQENASSLSLPAISVGAAFDFHAGLVSQAPLWMQQRGLEWLYRLYTQPRRLWRRYLIRNPLYLWMIALQGLGLWRPNEHEAKRTHSPMRFG